MLARAFLCILCLSLNPSFLMAESEPAQGTGALQNDYQYLEMEPDIITNYIKPGKRIGFVRISVDLMVNSIANYTLIETHEPLIRDRIITIFGQQSEEMVKMISEREGIRQRCIEEINELLFAETGKRPLTDLFFTKYLYQ